MRDAEALPSAPGRGRAGGDATGSELHERHEGEQGPPGQTFRDFYVKTFSSAFASELFDLRQVYITSHVPACFMSLPDSSHVIPSSYTMPLADHASLQTCFLRHRSHDLV